ncbi:MAG TPA: autotransporter assembly complex family protein, partial [Alphaproteobacteria bacterium]|nr:autotransporter assembly complex family protein [Alphaproteobacteria bacterium]
QVIEADKVLKAQAQLYQNIQKNKCYFQSDIAHEVILDHDNKTAQIIFNIMTQAQSTFGDVSFEGQEATKESYLRKLIPFKKGDCYRTDKLQSFREKMLATGLFARAEIEVPTALPEDHVIPVTVHLKERAGHTVRVGLSYYTDKGPGLVLGWIHRNFLGAAEKLEAQLKISTLQQKLGLELTKPFFLRKDQSLSLSAALERQDTDAFEELSIKTQGSINRSFNKYLSGSTGAALTLTRITDKTTDLGENYGLLSFPNSLNFDNRDDKLDPHKGWNIRGTVEPFVDAFGTSDPFFKTRLSASTYYGFSKDVVLAGRASVGSIMGADIENIPATERFYSGGGGSVRGFGYQEVGPQTNGDPSGGASVVEGSTELRFKVSDKIGAVAFVDAGNVSEEISPQFSNFSIGAGVGVRYYTSFGPLRFDVATPLTNKEDTDSNYQIYISIGQAF